MAIEVRHVFRTTPQAVWDVISDPGRVDWVAGVESATYDGEVRRFKMTGAGELAEAILTLDATQRLLEYGVVESTPPLDAHRASMQILDHDEGAELVWKTEVEPVAVEPFIKAGMEASLPGLHNVLGC